jgi:hypothetical protein
MLAMKRSGARNGAVAISEIEREERIGPRRLEGRRQLGGYGEVNVELPSGLDKGRGSIGGGGKKEKKPRASQAYFCAPWK